MSARLPQRRQLLALLPGAAWVALGGCASVVAPPPPTARGRLSLSVDDGAGARGFNAAFELAGGAEAGELRLSTVLGPQIAVARWDASGALLDEGGRQRRFDDLDALAREVLGEPVPLRALPDWLAGRPWPGAPSVQGSDGFEQLGWRLDLARWDEGFVMATREQPLPRVALRVRLERS